MKNRIYMYLAVLVLSLSAACSDDINAPVLTEDEYPRILGYWPDVIVITHEDGTEEIRLGEFGTNVGKPVEIKLQFTPSHLCTATWYWDGVEIDTGNDPDIDTSKAGTYHLKVVVQTELYETSREAYVVISE